MAETDVKPIELSEEQTIEVTARITEKGKSEEEANEMISSAESLEGLEATIEAIEEVSPPPEPGDIEYTKNVSKRITEAGKKTREAEDRALIAEQESQRLRDELEKKNTPEKPATSTPRPVRPEVGAFENDADYHKALDAYEDILYEWRDADRQAKAKASDDIASNVKKKADFEKKADEFRKDHDDFDTVVKRPVFSKPLISLIMESEYGPEISYHLGNNEAEAARIRKLPPLQLAREIGKLEAKVSTTPPVKKIVSGAPDPIVPLEGNDVVRKDESKLSMKEFATKRNSEKDF